MSSVKVPDLDLRDVDICDAGLESDQESGVFENSLGVLAENRPGLQDAHFYYHLKSHPESGNKTFTGLPTKRALVTDGAVCLEPLCHEAWTRHEEDDDRTVCRSSIVDCLLVELYDTYSSGKGLRSADSLDSSTEASGSDAFLGRSNTASSFLQELQEKHTKRHQRNYLAQKDPEELKWIIQELNYRIGIQSAKLVRQVKRKDRLHHKQQKKCDIITACLQAVSQKRSNT
ncbi:TBC1 domain family member 30 [Bagarius yarrelli]|uniref:TBC1 domain family member 30 n=1 Tax=Bagarius yarrelli TaxID=175774 RepID=A0A556TH92_BAGYA|nr:TBC1 domain family member 30 [Bagarius yarrelli]